MSESNYGYCNYCGKYRPLKWNGGYCSEKCYCESGQKEQDIIDSEERYELWYYRDDVGAFIYRSIVMSIGWLIYMIGGKMVHGGQSREIGKISLDFSISTDCNNSCGSCHCTKYHSTRQRRKFP